jgi:uncharacterized protein with PQ loop repeat
LLLSPALKRYFLPLLGAIVSFSLFQLALHHAIDARTFSSLEIPSVIQPNEYEGVYTELLARTLNSIFGDPELSFRLLTALATGCSLYFTQKLFPEQNKWSASFVFANISFLYFACHSPHAMLAVLLFVSYLSTWESGKPTKLATLGLLSSLMLGFNSLLAVALMLYALARVIISKETAKVKAVAIISLSLGIAIWLLLGYMMFASTGFLDAVMSGTSGLFVQVNPINFGVGLVITFNILLVWIFRSPSEKTTMKYLGSLLILLFLFVRVEPVDLVLLLILGVVYLYRTGSLPKNRWVLPGYALLNIALFFSLPPVKPLEAAYNVRAARPSDAELYYSSYFAKDLPSYRSLLSKAEMLSASRGFLKEKSSFPVILDPSLESAVDAAALRDAGSRKMIGGFNEKARRVRTVFDGDTSMIVRPKDATEIRYLATDWQPREMDSMLSAINAPRLRKAGVSYYSIDSSRFGQFFDLYIYHHYISFH